VSQRTKSRTEKRIFLFELIFLQETLPGKDEEEEEVNGEEEGDEGAEEGEEGGEEGPD
jgi:hypothetical protein